jgi:hypothetical protein
VNATPWKIVGAMPIESTVGALLGQTGVLLIESVASWHLLLSWASTAR